MVPTGSSTEARLAPIVHTEADHLGADSRFYSVVIMQSF